VSCKKPFNACCILLGTVSVCTRVCVCVSVCVCGCLYMRRVENAIKAMHKREKKCKKSNTVRAIQKAMHKICKCECVSVCVCVCMYGKSGLHMLECAFSHLHTKSNSNNNNNSNYTKCTTATFKNPKHTHTHTHKYSHTNANVQRVQVDKNKTFLQLIALNLKCCKINSRVMPNTQAQSFMQTETETEQKQRQRQQRGEQSERGVKKDRRG